MTRGPDPKDPSVRGRRNKTTTRAVLAPNEHPDIPSLPKGPRWHQQVKDWWTRAWSSPMVVEWTDSDVDNLYMAARLMQQFWASDATPNECKALAGEIRQIQTMCGLTPMARRSLQWEILRVEEAEDNKAKRAATKRTPAKRAAPKKADPRARFRVVS